MGDMIIKWVDFNEAMQDLLHSEELMNLIKNTRLSGFDVWLLDENGERDGLIVLCQDGKFRGQKIIRPAVL